MWSSFILLLFILNAYASDQIKSIFGQNVCIEGALSTITGNSGITLEMRDSVTASTIVETNNTNAEYNYETSIMSKLNELAQFNEIDYFYKLVKEEGPPHNKLFTISLTLGDEEFVAEGSSLKKAQQKAAAIALQESEYEPPPIKEKEENDDTTTPTVLLNNLCAKLGIAVEYFLVNKNDILNSNNVITAKSQKSYLQKLNESLYSEIQIRKDESQIKGPFKVRVQVGELDFYGTSHTIQSARHEAASKAIDHLVKEVQDGNAACLQEGAEEECKHAKASIKSPISLVYEAANLRNIPIEFEIIEESGPAHKRVFVTKCTLGHLYTTGAGRSKKESKKEAAKNMLERISELPMVSQDMQVNSILKQDKKKKKKKKKNTILKTNMDVINTQIENIIDSVKEYGLPFTSNQENIKKSPKNAKLKKSFQDEILELSNALKFEVQFMDFIEQGRYYTILSLHINPEHVCQGTSPKIARNKAAKHGLTLLSDIDLGSLLKNKKLEILESEIKQKINILLRKDIHEEEKD